MVMSALETSPMKQELHIGAIDLAKKVCHLRVGVPPRDKESIRELGGNDGHEAGFLKGREDRGRAPTRLMRVSASTT
jgi:hypothetical protein